MYVWEEFVYMMNEWMNVCMYDQRVCVFIQATYISFAFNDCSSVEEELQGREMPFLGGNPQSGTANLTEMIQNHVRTQHIHSWHAPYRPSLNEWPKQQFFTHMHIDIDSCTHLLCVFALGCAVHINTRSNLTLLTYTRIHPRFNIWKGMHA